MPQESPATILKRAAVVVLLTAAMPAPGATAPAPTPPVAILADNLCPAPAPDAISVCAARTRREDIESVHAYAACIAHIAPEAAAQAIADYRTRRVAGALAPLLAKTRACPPGGLIRASGILIEGALAEALLWQGRALRRLAGLPPPPAEAALPYELGDCVVARDGAGVAALLRSMPASHGERERIRALTVDLPPCLPAGLRLETNALLLRAVLALGAFARVALPADSEAAAAPPGITRLTALDLPPIVPRAPVLTLSVTPGLTVRPATPPRGDEMTMGHTHATADLPAAFDPEDLLATEAQAVTDTDGIDWAHRRPEAETDRARGRPY